MKVRSYTEADAAKWDEMAGRSACGTFLHSRRFLSYHGGRFEDLSVFCEDDQGRMAGIFPAARKLDDPACVASHPGATYGGLVHQRGLSAGDVKEMMDSIVRHFRSKGFQRLEYKSVPPHLQLPYSQADLYAIWKQGGVIFRRDLWNVAALNELAGYSDHHKREIARARKRAIDVGAACSDMQYREFHAVLTACLAERHGAAPVHDPDEMLQLRDRFPENMALWLARDGGGRLLAGSWVFQFPDRAWHTQYIATSPEGRSQGAGYLVMDELIRAATHRRIPFLSFGASTEDNGRALNAGLFEYKSGFGAGTVCHDIYLLRLTS